jgi:hypothetical protein
MDFNCFTKRTRSGKNLSLSLVAAEYLILKEFKSSILFILQNFNKDNRLNKGEYARKNGYRNKKYNKRSR